MRDDQIITHYINMIKECDYYFIKSNYRNRATFFDLEYTMANNLSPRSIITYDMNNIKFSFFVNRDDKYTLSESYMIINDIEICDQFTIIDELYQILKKISINMDDLVTDILKQLINVGIYTRNILNEYNHIDLLFNTRLDILEKIDEFDVIKDGKLDIISLDSLIEYYEI